MALKASGRLLPSVHLHIIFLNELTEEETLKCLVLSNKQSKTQRHSTHNNMKQRKPAYPHIGEAAVSEGLLFFLN